MKVGAIDAHHRASQYVIGLGRVAYTPFSYSMSRYDVLLYTDDYDDEYNLTDTRKAYNAIRNCWPDSLRLLCKVPNKVLALPPRTNFLFFLAKAHNSMLS